MNLEYLQYFVQIPILKMYSFNDDVLQLEFKKVTFNVETMIDRRKFLKTGSLFTVASMFISFGIQK